MKCEWEFMASIRKLPSGLWLAEVRLKALPKPQSKTFRTKPEAQIWAAELERMAGKRGPATHHTLRDAFVRYRTEVSPTKKGARWEIVRIKKFERGWLPDIRLADLTADDIQRWIGEQRELKLAPGSINRELKLIGSVITVARKRWKWHSGDPMKDVERPKNPPPRDRRISAKEEKAILKALGWAEKKEIRTATDEAALGFLLALETAMRQGELWNLRWEHVHLPKKFAHLPETKNGTKRDVPLGKRAIALLRKMGVQKRGLVFRHSQAVCGQMFRRAVKSAEINDLTFHDTRHEAITRLAGKIEVLDLQRMVGHTDMKSLRTYYNATASEIAGRLD